MSYTEKTMKLRHERGQQIVLVLLLASDIWCHHMLILHAEICFLHLILPFFPTAGFVEDEKS